MNDVAEDMVRVILEKLMVLASSKQSELAHLKTTTDPAYQQRREDPTYTFLQRASKRKSSAKTDAGSLIGKEEIQNLVSTLCSQSSLVGYIKDAISTIQGYTIFKQKGLMLDYPGLCTTLKHNEAQQTDREERLQVKPCQLLIILKIFSKACSLTSSVSQQC